MHVPSTRRLQPSGRLQPASCYGTGMAAAQPRGGMHLWDGFLFMEDRRRTETGSAITADEPLTLSCGNCLAFYAARLSITVRYAQIL